VPRETIDAGPGGSLFPPHIRAAWGWRQSPEPPALHMRAAWFELALAAVAPWCRDERGSGVGGGSRGYLTRAAGARLGVPGMSRLVGAIERDPGACRLLLISRTTSRRTSSSTARPALSASSATISPPSGTRSDRLHGYARIERRALNRPGCRSQPPAARSSRSSQPFNGPSGPFSSSSLIG
jgi:hypothetical protein